MSTIIAIDPGVNGGIAIGFSDGRKPPFLEPMPESVHDLAEALAEFKEDSHAFIEQVGGYIGGPGSPGARMFTFGQSYGQALGVLAALKIPTTLVTPQKWQGALGLGNSKGMTKSQWKSKLRIKAKQLYPGMHVTLATADALLIYHAALHRNIQK